MLVAAMSLILSSLDEVYAMLQAELAALKARLKSIRDTALTNVWSEERDSIYDAAHSLMWLISLEIAYLNNPEWSKYND